MCRPSSHFHISFLFFLATALIVPVAAKGVTCHCFRDRKFEPARPASADPYILATTRNSLVAAASGIDKGSVVRERMTGATEADLWLSRYLPVVTGASADSVRSARDGSPSWSAALDKLSLDAASLGSAFNEARKTGSAERMALALADGVLMKVFGTGEHTLARLHGSGADIAQATLSVFVARSMEMTPEQVLKEVQEGKRTWGAILNSLGIPVDTIGDRIAARVRAVIREEKGEGGNPGNGETVKRREGESVPSGRIGVSEFRCVGDRAEVRSQEKIRSGLTSALPFAGSTAGISPGFWIM